MIDNLLRIEFYPMGFFFLTRETLLYMYNKVRRPGRRKFLELKKNTGKKRVHCSPVCN